MIKDLVANLTVGAERDVVAQFAISVAQAFEAHIAGLAFAYEPVIVPTVMDGMSAAWIDTQRSENRAAAQKAIDCDREGLAGEHRLIEASLAHVSLLRL
jgi:hypothetical protein